VTDPVEPVGGIRVSSASPAKRLQPASRERDRQGGGRSPDERPDEPEEKDDEGEGGLHVDVLA
jgi:hypothetical protein